MLVTEGTSPRALSEEVTFDLKLEGGEECTVGGLGRLVLWPEVTTHAKVLRRDTPRLPRSCEAEGHVRQVAGGRRVGKWAGICQKLQGPRRSVWRKTC